MERQRPLAAAFVALMAPDARVAASYEAKGHCVQFWRWPCPKDLETRSDSFAALPRQTGAL